MQSRNHGSVSDGILEYVFGETLQDGIDACCHFPFSGDVSQVQQIAGHAGVMVRCGFIFGEDLNGSGVLHVFGRESVYAVHQIPLFHVLIPFKRLLQIFPFCSEAMKHDGGGNHARRTVCRRRGVGWPFQP